MPALVIDAGRHAAAHGSAERIAQKLAAAWAAGRARPVVRAGSFAVRVVAQKAFRATAGQADGGPDGRGGSVRMRQGRGQV